MFGFYRIAAAVPELKVADVEYNTNEIIRLSEEAARNGAALVLFPKLALTGATCGSLFTQKRLTDAAGAAACRIAEAFRDSGMIIVLGLPLKEGPATAVLSGGTVTALVPEQDDLILDAGAATLGLGTTAAALTLMPDAEPAIAGSIRNKRDQLKALSACHKTVMVYASAGVTESTTDAVYGGYAAICENGVFLTENKPFNRKSSIIYADTDLEMLSHIRQNNEPEEDMEITPLRDDLASVQYRTVDPLPFLPECPADCADIFEIQTAGLVKRLACSGSQKAVIGISGGLDSTLAILVAAEAVKRLGWKPEQLVALTMPGFGTTSRTKSNSEALSLLLGCDLRTVDITNACLQHFNDIGHDPAVLDVTYENVQARERTQILMDTANRERGLVVGTGDLSEIALGWSTYNADHMSMYNVNCGVTKTLVRVMVDWYAENTGDGAMKKVLKDVLATPVSPELLPADKTGAIAQKTESILGAYELHDFYLYHFIYGGAAPEKIRYLAELAFGNKYPAEELDRTLDLFFKRFFTQQFKRSCCPDGPQTGIVSLSPRTAWQMPSDAAMTLWRRS